MATTSENIVYRCACSWVGGDPDEIVVSHGRCPKCLGRSHRCESGGPSCRHCSSITCRHCSSITCAHDWQANDDGNRPVTFYALTCPACWKHDRKRVVVKPEERPWTTQVPPARRPADLFRIINSKTLEQSKVSRVLRFMIEMGEVSSAVFKQAHVEIGGTTNSTHAFDRYFKGKIRGKSGYVPSMGSHALLERRCGTWRVGKSPGPNSVRWIGSEGDDFATRLKNWLANLDESEIQRALMVIERELATDPENPITIAWFNAILLRSNEINSSAVRLETRLASTRTNDTTQIPSTSA